MLRSFLVTTMGKHYQKYEGQLVTLSRKLLRETKGDYLAVDFFQYICYWVLKNEHDGKNLHDGCYWTHFSVADIIKVPDYDYVTEWQAKRALRSLVEKKFVRRGVYNKKASDRTPWYTVDKETIAKYQPNLIALWDKKGREKSQPTTDEKTTRPREDFQPSTGGNSTEYIYTVDNNHCNNQTPNQEKEIIFLNNQHQQVDKVVSEDGDSSHESDSKNQYPFSAKEWQKWRTLLPKMPYSISDIEKLKEMVDEYGAESIEKNIKYFDDDYHRESMSKFLSSVEGGASSDRWEARQKKNGEYRLRW